MYAKVFWFESLIQLDYNLLLVWSSLAELVFYVLLKKKNWIEDLLNIISISSLILVLILKIITKLLSFHLKKKKFWDQELVIYTKWQVIEFEKLSV